MEKNSRNVENAGQQPMEWRQCSGSVVVVAILCVCCYLQWQFFSAQCLGRPDQFLDLFLVFSTTLLSLLFLLPYCYYYYYYYCCCCCCYQYCLLLLLLLFPRSFWLCVTGAWAGARLGGQGSWLGCGQGRLLGCSCYLGSGSAAPAFRFLATQPPRKTQALMVYLKDLFCVLFRAHRSLVW